MRELQFDLPTAHPPTPVEWRGISSAPARCDSIRKAVSRGRIMQKLIGWLTISASVAAAALGEITVGLPFFGVLIGSAVLLSLDS
jgi:hypothetical protein